MAELTLRMIAWVQVLMETCDDINLPIPPRLVKLETYLIARFHRIEDANEPA